eukprot:g58952.t1
MATLSPSKNHTLDFKASLAGQLLELAKDPLVASKTPTSEGVAEWLNDHVDANALRDEAYNIKKQIDRKKVALIKARKKLEKVIRLNAKGRNKPDGGAASTWTAEGTKIKLDPDEGQQIWKSAFEIRREEKEKEEAAEAGQPRRGKKRSMALYAAECEEIFKEMDGHKDVLPKAPHPLDATYERTFGNGHTHVPGRKKRRQLKNLHHPGAIKVLMPVAAAALAVKKQEKKEYVIVSDSDDDDEGSRNMPKLLAPQARAAAARQAWLSEVDNIEHELDRINEQFESYKKQKHIGTTVGTATATTTTAVPSHPYLSRKREQQEPSDDTRLTFPVMLLREKVNATNRPQSIYKNIVGVVRHSNLSKPYNGIALIMTSLSVNG